MSVQALSWVLEHSRATHDTRLTAIALANWCDEDGVGGATKARLASAARISEASIWRGLRELQSLGEIAQVSADGAPAWWRSLPSNRRPNLWRILGVANRDGNVDDGVRGVIGVGREGATPPRPQRHPNATSEVANRDACGQCGGSGWRDAGRGENGEQLVARCDHEAAA